MKRLIALIFVLVLLAGCVSTQNNNLEEALNESIQSGGSEEPLIQAVVDAVANPELSQIQEPGAYPYFRQKILYLEKREYPILVKNIDQDALVALSFERENVSPYGNEIILGFTDGNPSQYSAGEERDITVTAQPILGEDFLNAEGFQPNVVNLLPEDPAIGCIEVGTGNTICALSGDASIGVISYNGEEVEIRIGQTVAVKGAKVSYDSYNNKIMQLTVLTPKDTKEIIDTIDFTLVMRINGQVISKAPYRFFIQKDISKDEGEKVR